MFIELRGAIENQIQSFFNIVQKGREVKKICYRLCMILKAFWQQKFDIKRLYKGSNVSDRG